MQFSESWLRSFCDPDLSSEALADTLTMAGLEVEENRPVAPPFSGVVVARVLDVQPHPDADRLRICRVDAGLTEPLQIVCGAPNVQAGIHVPCALVGAELPSAKGQPFLIKQSKLRGVDSQGMLCSAKELGVGDSHEGLMVLSSNAPVGMDLRSHLMLDDRVFVLKLTPNLAHCLSVRGVAREVSAITGQSLNEPQIADVPVQLPDVLKVHVHGSDLCGRFSGRIIRGVNVRAQTPSWMVDQLARCGQRSVNVLVDISNYVMFELGQPTHIFDLDKIQGDLHVRWANAGETLTLLNGQTVELDANVGVIADDAKVESLAGIMGGQATAVSDETKNIYIEAAFWWPASVAGRSRRFNFSTDAGHRFERGVDAQGTIAAIERISQLVLQICADSSGQCGPIDDQILEIPSRPLVKVRVDRVNRILGLQLSERDMINALDRSGLQPRALTNAIEIQPPSHRFDLNLEEDVIEEIARMVGFDRLPNTPPVAPIQPRVLVESKQSTEQIKRQMASLGYQETINFSFVEHTWETRLHGNPDPIRVLNPIASHLSVMRSSLLGSLLQVVKYNADRQLDAVHAFELGRVFRKDQSVAEGLSDVGGFAQPLSLAGIRAGQFNPLQWGQANRAADFFDVKADVEFLLKGRQLEFKAESHPGLHPGRSARIYCNDVPAGWIGELHPSFKSEWHLTLTPIYFEISWDWVVSRPVPSALAISRFPTVSRDIAVVVPEQIPLDRLLQVVWSVDHSGYLKDVTLFDVYRPKVSGERGLQLGEKSMAIHLVLNDIHGTLTDEQIDRVRLAIIDQLKAQLNARLRD